jgi:hypothetical protein
MAIIERNGIEILDPDDELRMIDELAREYLGISGEAFIQAWHEGEFDDDPDRPEVIRIAMLLPPPR